MISMFRTGDGFHSGLFTLFFFMKKEHILVRILTIQGDSPETLSIHADVKSVEGNTSKENLKNCRVQGKYAGTVEDIHKGTVFVRLELGVNAIAHICYDSRTVGKKDMSIPGGFTP